MMWQLLLVGLAVGQVVAASSDTAPGTVTAHPDGQCAKPLANGAGATFQFKTGFPKFDTYKAQEFPGAETPDNSGGWIVYWKFPQPQPGCRNILMVPYNQPSHDESQPAPGGMELVNTDRAGCFSTTIRVDEDVLLSYCCGAGDCQAASLGSGALLAAPVEQSPPSQSSKASTLQPSMPSGPVPEISKRELTVKSAGEKHRSSFAGSPAARASRQKRWYYPAPPAPPEHHNCTFAPGTPFARLGRQVLVSDFQLCNVGECSFEAQHQTSMGTSLTSSTEQTITNSIGVSTSVEAGVDFLVDGKVSTTISADYSQAVTDTTGKEISKGNSTSMNTHVNVQAGTNVAVTFIPLFKCWTGAWDCGHGVNKGIDLCQPSLLSDGVTQDGYYRTIAAP